MEEVGGKDRVTAFGFHPNNIARILALALLSAAGLVYAVKKSAFKSHLWVWIIVALLGVTIVQTGSRGGIGSHSERVFSYLFLDQVQFQPEFETARSLWSVSSFLSQLFFSLK